MCGDSFKVGVLVVEDDCLIVPTFASPSASLTQFRPFPVPLSVAVVAVDVVAVVAVDVLREEWPSADPLLLLLSAMRCICRMTVAA